MSDLDKACPVHMQQGAGPRGSSSKSRIRRGRKPERKPRPHMPKKVDARGTVWHHAFRVCQAFPDGSWPQL